MKAAEPTEILDQEYWANEGRYFRTIWWPVVNKLYGNRSQFDEAEWANVLTQIKKDGDDYLRIAYFFACDHPYNNSKRSGKKWFTRFYKINGGKKRVARWGK